MRLRGWGSVATALFVVLLAASPSLAGGPEYPTNADSGNEGVHIVIDSPAYPGATCRYHPGDGLLTRIRVRAPIVYAVDRTKHVDRQTVKWDYVIWTATDPAYSSWNRLATGPLQSATATDRSNARFSDQSYAVPAGLSGDYFFVQVQVRWRAPGGGVEGRSTMDIVALFLAYGTGGSVGGNPYCAWDVN